MYATRCIFSTELHRLSRFTADDQGRPKVTRIVKHVQITDRTVILFTAFPAESSAQLLVISSWLHYSAYLDRKLAKAINETTYMTFLTQ